MPQVTNARTAIFLPRPDTQRFLLVANAPETIRIIRLPTARIRHQGMRLPLSAASADLTMFTIPQIKAAVTVQATPRRRIIRTYHHRIPTVWDTTVTSYVLNAGKSPKQAINPSLTAANAPETIHTLRITQQNIPHWGILLPLTVLRAVFLPHITRMMKGVVTATGMYHQPSRIFILHMKQEKAITILPRVFSAER
jgi:hypothetical protein